MLEIFWMVGSMLSALAKVAKKSGTATGPSFIVMLSGLVLPWTVDLAVRDFARLS
jgi:hypothetical protein